MHVRISKVNRNGKTYEYPQLVQSFRRPKDGMPAHRVVASLKDLSELEVHNLRRALEAAKQGRGVVVAPQRRNRPGKVNKPIANLRYLDVAVLLQLWNEWELSELLRDVLPRDLDPQVVAALAIQRCTAPGSKLAATRWFQRTALPEVLGISLRSFNNSRVHRVLSALERADETLQLRLARKVSDSQGAFTALFADLTDTWFVGHGPAIAQRAKTKEGLIRRKVGIALMCNSDGYPLRWQTVNGRSADAPVLNELLNGVRSATWAASVPVVLDRAMGTSAWLARLHATGLHFLTALVRAEFSSYAPNLPHGSFANLQPDPAPDGGPDPWLAKARALAVEAGMDRVDDDLFIGGFEIIEIRTPTPQSQPLADHAEPTVRAMALCRALEVAVQTGAHGSYAAAGKALGLKAGVGKKYRQLAKLPESIQQDILTGRASGQSLAALIRIAKLQDHEAGRSAFEALVAAQPKRRPPVESGEADPAPDAEEQAPEDTQSIQLRAVASFNPELFVEQRRKARSRLEEIDKFIEQLNCKLANPRSTRDKQGVAAEVDRRLRRDNFLKAFEVDVQEQAIAGKTRLQVTVTLNSDDWEKRRRYDGFSVIVGHCGLKLTAEQFCRVYRAKDAVEKDFEIIKGLLKLRPLHHRTEPKVHAHVTICMLALLLERTLSRRLRGKHSGKAALEQLQDCDLNLYETQGADMDAYTITRPNTEQADLLRQLGMAHLADDAHLADSLMPRQA
jgi:transposase